MSHKIRFSPANSKPLAFHPIRGTFKVTNPNWGKNSGRNSNDKFVREVAVLPDLEEIPNEWPSVKQLRQAPWAEREK